MTLKQILSSGTPCIFRDDLWDYQYIPHGFDAEEGIYRLRHDTGYREGRLNLKDIAAIIDVDYKITRMG